MLLKSPGIAKALLSVLLQVTAYCDRVLWGLLLCGNCGKSTHEWSGKQKQQSLGSKKADLALHVTEVLQVIQLLLQAVPHSCGLLLSGARPSQLFIKAAIAQLSCLSQHKSLYQNDVGGKSCVG